MRVLARVPSLSTDGVWWDITHHPRGPECACPAYVKGRVDPCSHLEIYHAAQHALQRCMEAGHMAVAEDDTKPALCEQCLIVLIAALTRKVRRSYVPKEKVAEVKEKAKAKVHDIRERMKARRKKQ